MSDSKERIYEGVRGFYADRIKESMENRSCSCCGDSSAGIAEQVGYTDSELAEIPEEASGASFGCGNPLAFTEVKPGETVLDLGSGGGIDCFLAAKKVGGSGKVIGVDMTEDMVEKARETAEQNGYENVEFRLGQIEDMPVETASVDWVISNCVINLSPEKEKVFAEAYRVLRPGGRLLVSDVVAENLPDSMREDITAWASCVSGAVSEDEYIQMVREAGFDGVRVVDQVEHLGPSCSHSVRISSIRVKGIKR